VHTCDVGRQVVVASRPAALLWAWNVSPHSYTDIRLPGAPQGGRWRALCSSDDAAYGGHARVQLGATYGGDQQIYLPSRTVIVLEHVAQQ
jgi:1,4-alpha-glucan branching enzyme